MGSWVGPRPFIDFNLNLDVHFCGIVDAGLFDVQPVAKSASAFMSICVRMSTGPVTHWQQYWLLTGCIVWCIHMTADVYRFLLGVQAHGTHMQHLCTTISINAAPLATVLSNEQCP